MPSKASSSPTTTSSPTPTRSRSTSPTARKLKAELVGTDTKTDIAVLKVDPKLQKLTAVKFGDSDTMRIGDWVMAIGNPFGLGGTVTVGIISARNRDINAGPYDDFIQTDAAINRGNSGGPLFNMDGEVVGINTAIISPSGGSIGIGFSIPSRAGASASSTSCGEFGETRRGWLGVRIQPVTDEIAESLGMDKAKGALVAGVIKGGPVDNGSILPGDVIIKFDGKDVNEMRDLPRVVAESPVGKAVDVVIVRKGVEQTVKVTLGRLEDGEKLADTEDAPDQPSRTARPRSSTAKVLGMTIGELDEETRKKFDISKDVSGVVVTEVAAEFGRRRARHRRRRGDHRDRAGIGVDAAAGARPHLGAEGAGPQERAADAGLEVRRAALRDDPHGLRAAAFPPRMRGREAAGRGPAMSRVAARHEPNHQRYEELVALDASPTPPGRFAATLPSSGGELGAIPSDDVRLATAAGPIEGGESSPRPR